MKHAKRAITASTFGGLVSIIVIGAIGNSARSSPTPHASASPPVDGTTPSAMAVTIDPQAAFFDALNREPKARDSALVGLRQRVLDEPLDARAVLLLGVAHLWMAAESPPEPARALEHMILARHYLARAAAMNPQDDRIPTWLHSAEVSVAHAERRDSDANAALEALRAHATRDPCFHSVAFAICVWDGEPNRPELAEAQRYLELAAACEPDDPSVRNLPRWPHNVEGFLVGLSDVALKRGDRARALAALVAAESWPGGEDWPHRIEVDVRRRDFETRAALFSDADPANDPAFIFERGGPVSCISCHQGRGG